MVKRNRMLRTDNAAEVPQVTLVSRDRDHLTHFGTQILYIPQSVHIVCL